MRDTLPGVGLGPLTGLVASTALAFWLAARTLATGAALAASPGRAADLPDAVAVLLLGTGCAAAAWYALTCTLALLIRLGRAAGATTSGLEHAVRRWGFPVLRRAVLTTVAAGAGLSLAVGAAGAAPRGGEPAVPQDLGWGADTVSAQPTEVGTRLGAAARQGLQSDTDAGDGAVTVPPLPHAAGTPGAGGLATDGQVDAAAPPAIEAVPAPTAGAARDGGRAGQGSPGTSQPAGAPGTGPGLAGPGTSPGPAGPGTSPGPAGPGTSPAHAGHGDPTADSTPRPGPNRSTPETSPPPATTAARTPASLDEHAPPGDARTYRVRPGDSLWSIAATHVGEPATTEEVARAWPEWYRANRAELGTNPHLIHPGQLLHVPDEEAS
ncbi:LysM peptidoglycan-binding domain-containing protein [Georgenia daeguensis]|uniref:LysM domain-containing protein n=1 Tax=Georgenia daeguensis TaxID=908355 RepID=A0ABP8EY95_9MICO